MSVPAETELAAILVPNWARANAKAIMNTPKRSPESAPLRKLVSRSRGFQIGSP